MRIFRGLRFKPDTEIGPFGIFDMTYTLMERKLRMPQIQGVQGRSRSNLLRALGNEGDEVSSAFPKGEQN